MKIVIIGPGAIGSTFAWQLARNGHDVTVVARGNRLAWLERERAIVRSDGERAPVAVASTLDPAVAWDLALVTVLATQVEAVLPSLRASAARRIMFMFNTFESLEPLRAAVGPERATFGFPGGVFALLEDGLLRPQIRAGTTVADAAWAAVFSKAGIPTVVEPDMQSWLRTHAALVAPLMAMSTVVVARAGAGVSWRESATYAAALAAGFTVVRAVGSALRPSPIALLAGFPRWLSRALFWALSRTQTIRDLGQLGAAEPRMLVDMMSAAAPELGAPLRAIRP